MHNFKIIAFRTGRKKTQSANYTDYTVTLDSLRNLKENVIYILRNEYKFPNGDFLTVEYDPEKEVGMYQIKSHNTIIPVNISAIVGGNGSGKSTLVELLYWACYNIGAALGLLESKNPFKFIELELLYSTNSETLTRLEFTNGLINKYQYHKHENVFQIENASMGSAEVGFSEIRDLQQFFYTIAVNYSHYSLNSAEIGDWIRLLFHKNDGYQVPIVLNPMRTRGNIDINRETQLLTRRLIANLLEPVSDGPLKDSLRNIANGKVATHLELKLDKKWKKTIPKAEISLSEETKHLLLHSIEKHFGRISNERDEQWPYHEHCLEYIYEKLFKIIEYKGFGRFKGPKSDPKQIKDLDAFIWRIKKSNSHVVFKVKGAILYLKYHRDLLPGMEIGRPYRVSIQDLSDRIQSIKNREPYFVNTFMMAPPSIFKVNIIPENGIPFESLSSGEKQKIHSISSIAYHLINLNSVELEKGTDSEVVINYPYINIVLDEIELYYHPEWQRTYISDLLSYLSKINPLNLSNIRGINCIFLTHSPYILSDIPSTNVLKLKNGAPCPHEEDARTFAANIHDLLANEFFMENGFMGEFARVQIDKLIKEIQGAVAISKEDFSNNFKKRIEIIGEPFLQAKLFELVATKLQDDVIDQIIAMRSAEIEKLKILKNQNKNDKN